MRTIYIRVYSKHTHLEMLRACEAFNRPCTERINLWYTYERKKERERGGRRGWRYYSTWVERYTCRRNESETGDGSEKEKAIQTQSTKEW